MVMVAGVSALQSSISATWSTAGLQLLVYAALATGPLGALRPWWLPPLWLLAGVCWTLLLLEPGRLLRPRTMEQRRVAAVYRELAANLRTLGSEGLGAARQDVTPALNTAYEELLSQRAAEAAGTGGWPSWWPCSTRPAGSRGLRRAGVCGPATAAAGRSAR
jgi:FUSC-like inner membrane protein yccS